MKQSGNLQTRRVLRRSIPVNTIQSWTTSPLKTWCLLIRITVAGTASTAVTLVQIVRGERNRTKVKVRVKVEEKPHANSTTTTPVVAPIEIANMPTSVSNVGAQVTRMLTAGKAKIRKTDCMKTKEDRVYPTSYQTVLILWVMVLILYVILFSVQQLNLLKSVFKMLKLPIVLKMFNI